MYTSTSSHNPIPPGLEPFRGEQPMGIIPDLLVANAIPQDERIWVPQAPNVWFRPLCLNITHGYWVNLLRVRKSGILSRHRHPCPVHALVLKGRWYYLEHDWVAEEGSYAFEPPGETHTLYVPDDVEEMITLFNTNGAMIYVDPDGNAVGYDDVFTKIEMCRKHYEAVGLGANYIDQFVR
ncbi:2,4'-dihydroxyacetophenone dioxygenase [Chelatococcus asaccharovorans]|nr:2,4'-dihydroxyacetophenone dioxygenase [Chelatococcus asaccharovorans]CAH1685981.1 2,4'-dihydroxyacetophenone dioxygenase [Chelatococcus asaccharovorans]